MRCRTGLCVASVEQLESRKLLSGVIPNGVDNDLGYDGNGNLDVVYFDAASTTLKWTRRNSSGVWSTPVQIDSTPNAGFYPTLTHDSNHRPVVAYYDATNGDLKYSRYNGTSWITVTVDSQNTTGLYPSIIYEGDLDFRISYYNKTAGDLKIVHVDGSTVGTPSTLDSTGDVGRYSLLLSPQTGTYYVAYADNTNGSLKFWNQSTFVMDSTLPNGPTYISGFLSNDLYGPILNLSYYDSFNADLKVVSEYASGYQGPVVGTVASANTQGLYSNAFLFDGHANIVYYNKTADTLMRARYDNGWTFTTLITGGGRNARVGVASSTFAYSNSRTGSNDLYIDDI